MSQRLYGIVYGAYLTRVNAVFLNDRVTCQVTYAHDVIRHLHTAFLNRENGRIDVTATSVEIRSVYVYHQWLAADLLGEDPRRIRQPIMAVDDIEIQGVCQHGCYSLVVADLFDQVIGIATRETDATEVVCADTTVVITDSVTETVVVLRTHPAFHALFDVVVIYIFPYYRHAVGANDTQERLILVAPWFGNDERDLHVWLLSHTTGQTITGCS